MNQQITSIDERHKPKNNKLCRTALFLIINLSLILSILSCFYFKNNSNLEILNYPANSKAESCYIKYSKSYPFLYIDMTTMNPQYRCVNECPKTDNQYTIMDSTGQFIVCPSQLQNVDQRYGGICWSPQKQKLLQSRGLLVEFQSKSMLLNKFSTILKLSIAAFILGTASAITFYWFASKFYYYTIIILSFGLLAYFMYYIASSNFLLYKNEVMVFMAKMLIFFIINVITFKTKLDQSVKYSQQVKNRFQNDTSSSVCKFLKCLSISMAFSIAHFFLLVLILYEYVSIVSTEQLVKKDNEIYFNIERTWWKYLLLLFQWLFFSNLLQKIYQYILVKTGYRLIRKNNNKSPICFTFPDLLNIYLFAAIQTILWIPLKIIYLVKPSGSILRKKDQQTFCQKLSRCCFCCCGVGINYLHKLTFNPFLVLALQPSFDDLDNSLAVVQQVYHKQDPSYDKTSLWLGRLSNYINISIISACYLQYYSKGELPTSFSNLFIVFAVVVALQICQYNLTMWSILSEVTQFVNIVQSRKGLDITV